VADPSLGQRQYVGDAPQNFGRSSGPSVTLSDDPYGERAGGSNSLINAAGRTTTTSRRGRGRTVGLGGVHHGGPLDLSNVDEILQHSGFGPSDSDDQDDETSDERAIRMSDADAPSQTTTTGPDGSVMHHRRNTDGSVTSRGIGAYSPPDYFTEPV
jgi:hypothetical protein